MKLPQQVTFIIRAYTYAIQQLNRDVRLYLLTAMNGVYSILLNLYLLRLGHGPRFIGLVNAAGQFAFITISIPAGVMGRRWGRVASLSWAWLVVF